MSEEDVLSRVVATQQAVGALAEVDLLRGEARRAIVRIITGLLAAPTHPDWDWLDYEHLVCARVREAGVALPADLLPGSDDA